MCMISVVTQAGMDIPLSNWTPSSFSEFQEILKRLDALDRKLGLSDCEDPAKALWMKSVESRLRALEAAKV